MADLTPIGTAAVAKASTVTQPKAADPGARSTLLTAAATSTQAAPLPLFWTPPRTATSPPATIWTQYAIKLVTVDGVPIKQERCVLVTDRETLDRRTDDKGMVTFTVPTVARGQAAHVSEDVVDAPRGPLLVLPDILEDFADLPNAADPLQVKRNLPPASTYRTGDRMLYPVIALTSAAMEVRVNALTEQQKFEHFRWSYVSNDATYVTTPHGDFGKQPPRWEWSRGASCNQHVNFFLGYWFNYNASFTASGKNTDTAYLPILDCGAGKFPYRKETAAHRGYAAFVEPITDFHAATHLADFNDKTFPGRDKILTTLLGADGTPNKSKWSVRPEQYAKYIRLSRLVDFTSRQLNAEGQRFVDALADFNMYSVSEYYGSDAAASRASALSSTTAWLKKNRALPRLQQYSVARGKSSAPLAQMTDAEIATMAAARVWEILWKLDDAQPEDAALLTTLRGGLNIDHHAGILVKRAVGNHPLTGSGPVELWKFSADGTEHAPQPIVMKRFLNAFAERSNDRLFTHYAVWKLKPLRAGGFAPNDEATRLAVAGKVRLDEPPRFIRWA